MTASNTQIPSSILLGQLHLGDILCLPDGRTNSVRAVMARLPNIVGSMSGFVLAGEIGPDAVLLSLPASPGSPIVLYSPLDRVPAHAADAIEVVSGIVTYWSPHVPGVSGAMGQLGYKVCVVRGQTEPMVLLWRGNELVVFVHSAVCSADAINITFLARDTARTEKAVTRVGVDVTSPDRATVDAETTGGLYERFVTSRPK